MPATDILGYFRQSGSAGRGATLSVGLQCVQFTLDPTAASADTGKVLPSGCLPLFAQNLDGGGTGGTSPTVDIGTSGDPDGFANELAADAPTTLVVGGALLGTALTADTPIYAGVGASAATGGTTTLAVYYVMVDAG